MLPVITQKILLLRQDSWLFCLKPGIKFQQFFCNPVFSVLTARFALFVALLSPFQNVMEPYKFL